MRFTSFYAGSTVCAPSRCALMTGLHTGHGLIRGNGTQALRPEDLTVAELLKRAGYHTGLVGKWGLGNEHTTGVPQRKGFDDFVGFLDQTHAHDYYTDHLWRYDPATGRDQLPDLLRKHGRQTPLYIHDLFTVAAHQLRPPPHARPLQSLPALLPLPRLHHPPRQQRGRPAHRQRHASAQRRPLFEQPWPQAEKNKAAMITRLDRDVGQLMERLERTEDRQQHDYLLLERQRPAQGRRRGPEVLSSAGPLRGIKRDLYEGGIRVPLIVRWPGKIKPGQVNDDPWAFWDFLPTAAGIAGAPRLPNLDGISMLPTLLGETQTNRHEFLYWEFHERGFQQAVRMGDWKAVRLQPGQPLELYNLKTDAGEKQNVADQNPEVVAKMEEYLKTARSDSAAWPMQKPAPSRVLK